MLPTTCIFAALAYPQSSGPGGLRVPPPQFWELPDGPGLRHGVPPPQRRKRPDTGPRPSRVTVTLSRHFDRDREYGPGPGPGPGRASWHSVSAGRRGGPVRLSDKYPGRDELELTVRVAAMPPGPGQLEA
jgi:hypothetical protein